MYVHFIICTVTSANMFQRLIFVCCFLLGTYYLSFYQIEVWIGFIEFLLKTQLLCLTWDQHPDLRRLKESLVLIMQCLTSLCYCHTSNISIHIVIIIIIIDYSIYIYFVEFCETQLFTTSSLSVFSGIVYFCVNISFDYFCILEKSLYFNCVKMCVQVLTKIRATYLFIEIYHQIQTHTALC